MVDSTTVVEVTLDSSRSFVCPEDLCLFYFWQILFSYNSSNKDPTTFFQFVTVLYISGKKCECNLFYNITPFFCCLPLAQNANFPILPCVSLICNSCPLSCLFSVLTTPDDETFPDKPYFLDFEGFLLLLFTLFLISPYPSWTGYRGPARVLAITDYFISTAVFCPHFPACWSHNSTALTYLQLENHCSLHSPPNLFYCKSSV